MGIYKNFNDTPEKIKFEGQEITLKLKLNGDGTATIEWNIPAPSGGDCSLDDMAYRGIVITVSDKPSNYLDTSPENGTFYKADPTFDPDLHAGDKISYARVVGAFYNDTSTTSLTVTDAKDLTAYYVSAYAVDNVGRYHREGVHAYSLPTASEESQRTSRNASVCVRLDSLPPLEESDPTGLDPLLTYNIEFKVDGCKTYAVSIDGSLAQTYGELVAELNNQFSNLESYDNIAGFPNAGEYVIKDGKLYIWDGSQLTTFDYITISSDPTVPQDGQYWLNAGDLYVWDSALPGWQAVSPVLSTTDPTSPECNAIWFNGTEAYRRVGNHWELANLIISDTHPLDPPDLTCNTFWFDETYGGVRKFDTDTRSWVDVVALYSPKAPENFTTGDYWFDSSTDNLNRMVGGVWNVLNNVVVSDDEPAHVASSYWYMPTSQRLLQRDYLNTQWVEIFNVVTYRADPTDRANVDYWWDSTPVVDTIKTYDDINNVWVDVDKFFQTTIDPSLPANVPVNTVWYNPTTAEMTLIGQSGCNAVGFIQSSVDPTNLPSGTVWFDTLDYRVWDGSNWTTISYVTSTVDPYIVDVGYMWWDGSALQQWDGANWNTITVSDYNTIVPAAGYRFYNTTDSTIYEWDGEWKAIDSLITAVFIKGECDDTLSKICFVLRDVTCGKKIEFSFNEVDALLSGLQHLVIYEFPSPVNVAGAGGPMQKQLGVGTDGSPDERRALHKIIRDSLGNPSTTAELTKAQIDMCIDNALDMIRKYSSYAYKRGFFFLDLYPNQQTYILDGTCVGFNKIVEIYAINRMRAGFISGSADNNMFGFAALQQLFNRGTFDLLSFHLISSYINEVEMLFASQLTYNWDETSRILKLYHEITLKERVLIDASIERTEQDLLTFRETTQWIKKWAIAEAKMILSQVRGKYQSLPGPNGSTTLNSQELITQSENEKAELKAELESMNMQDLIGVGASAQFVIG